MEIGIDVTAEDAVGGELSHRGAVLESVAGSATYNPDVVEIRVAVDDEVSVRCVFGLADAAADHRLPRESWKAVGHIVVGPFKLVGRDDSLVEIRIERIIVVRRNNPEASAVKVRKPVVEILSTTFAFGLTKRENADARRPGPPPESPKRRLRAAE